MNLSRERQPNETLDAYHERLRFNAYRAKKVVMLHDSNRRGTYFNPEKNAKRRLKRRIGARQVRIGMKIARDAMLA